jgi:hypothetical protein
MDIGTESLGEGSVPCETYAGIHQHRNNEDVYPHHEWGSYTRPWCPSSRRQDACPRGRTAAVNKVVCIHATQGSGGVPPLILEFGSGETSRD